ncbi:hypothetical protein ILUMI_04339 [Ignelater luminosus]|uniref:Uncharacterized protein n=1 Tax=Ignelater luminosus TaxID=2038154 RepID=A0A8K0GJN8_IGNLU|nr:hypothetical protein ILUMI_04339 [Ignelater luminosus]
MEREIRKITACDGDPNRKLDAIKFGTKKVAEKKLRYKKSQDENKLWLAGQVQQVPSKPSRNPRKKSEVETEVVEVASALDHPTAN